MTSLRTMDDRGGPPAPADGEVHGPAGESDAGEPVQGGRDADRGAGAGEAGCAGVREGSVESLALGVAKSMV